LPIFYKDDNNNSSNANTANTSSTSTSSAPEDEGTRLPLPRGFIATFVLVPLLTYAICLAVVWIFGLNDSERKAAVVGARRRWNHMRSRAWFLVRMIFMW